MKLRMTLFGNFAFFEDRKKEELLIVLPYMKEHFAMIQTGDRKFSLHHHEPCNFSLAGVRNCGNLGSVVDSTNDLLCMKKAGRKKAKCFGSIRVPLYFGITTPLKPVKMENPVTINSGSVTNRGMIKFAEQFVLTFECDRNPRLENDEGDDITLSCGEVFILCGPKTNMDCPHHRALAVKANAAHFTGLDIKWDGHLGVNTRAEAPGCSPSLGNRGG